MALKLVFSRDTVFTDVMKSERQRLAKGATKAVREASRALEKDLEAAGKSAGLGRLAMAWDSRVYPKDRDSLNAAGEVYAKGGKDGATQKALEAFGAGAVIRSAAKFFLAIPTDAAPRRGTDGKRIKPSTFPEGRFNRLRFVYRRGAPSLLVVDNLRARTGKMAGKFARASKRAIAKAQTSTVIMFILLPLVRLRQRFDLKGIERRGRERLRQLAARYMSAR